MTHTLACFRCGTSLAALSLPIGRQDACPECAIHLHVCRMCMYFDPQVPKQCREDDAEEVFEKEQANFCEWYKPSADAFDPARGQRSAQAQNELAALFGDDGGNAGDPDGPLHDAEDLFK